MHTKHCRDVRRDRRPISTCAHACRHVRVCTCMYIRVCKSPILKLSDIRLSNFTFQDFKFHLGSNPTIQQLCVCVFVCVCVCMCVYVYVFMCVHVYGCMYLCVYVYVCMCVTTLMKTNICNKYLCRYIKSVSVLMLVLPTPCRRHRRRHLQ